MASKALKPGVKIISSIAESVQKMKRKRHSDQNVYIRSVFRKPSTSLLSPVPSRGGATVKGRMHGPHEAEPPPSVCDQFTASGTGDKWEARSITASRLFSLRQKTGKNLIVWFGV